MTTMTVASAEQVLDLRVAPVSKDVGVAATAERVSGVSGDVLAGPLLAFGGQPAGSGRWPVTMLMVVEGGEASAPRVLHSGNPVEPELLMELSGRHFLRYAFPVSQTNREQRVSYQVGEKVHDYVVPALGQSAHWMYFSCNGYQTESDRTAVGGIAPMWKQFNADHAKNPYHLLAGGGDQVYCDGIVDGTSGGKDYGGSGVFHLQSIAEWLKLSPEERDNAPFTDQMSKEVTDFYVSHYCKQFSELEFKDALASVPYLMSWDDHDIFDGFGSYPPELQNSRVFQGIFNVALTLYLLVQQQTTVDEARSRGLFGKDGYTFLRLIDDGQVAILGMDTRSERKREQVVSDESWAEAFRRLENLPANCKHLVVMLSVPLIYPSLQSLEKVFDLADKSTIFGSLIGFLPGMKNQFQLWELDDDGGDSWGSYNHTDERAALVSRLQELAARKSVRVTLLGGDVHLGGAGKIYNKSEVLPAQNDPNLIWQVISSPMGNVTPPKFVATLLSGLGALKQKVYGDIRMRMTDIYRKSNPQETARILSRRHYATLQRDTRSGHLDVEYHVERNPTGKHAGDDLKVYTLSVPQLVASRSGSAAATPASTGFWEWIGLS